MESASGLWALKTTAVYIVAAEIHRGVAACGDESQDAVPSVIQARRTWQAFIFSVYLLVFLESLCIPLSLTSAVPGHVSHSTLTFGFQFPQRLDELFQTSLEAQCRPEKTSEFEIWKTYNSLPAACHRCSINRDGRVDKKSRCTMEASCEGILPRHTRTPQEPHCSLA